MSRFLYWTIVLGTEPTSFRASEAEELLPTLTQLRRKHPDATLRWFQRGRLWISPDDAKAALSRERSDAKGRPATWRPGGKHVDPRQKYIDAKKAKWTKFKSAIRERAESRRDVRGDGDDRPRTDTPPVERPREEQPPIKPDAAAPPSARKPRGDWRAPTEPGDAPRLVREPVVRRPQPIEPDAPVARDRKPALDRDRKPAFDRGSKPPFDRDRKPAFDRRQQAGRPASIATASPPSIAAASRPSIATASPPSTAAASRPSIATASPRSIAAGPSRPRDRDAPEPAVRSRQQAALRSRPQTRVRSRQQAALRPRPQAGSIAGKPPFDRDRKPGGEREGTRPPGNRPLADWRPKTVATDDPPGRARAGIDREAIGAAADPRASAAAQEVQGSAVPVPAAPASVEMTLAARARAARAPAGPAGADLAWAGAPGGSHGSRAPGGRRAVRGSRSREAFVLTHVVLFKPRPGLAGADADALIAAIERAARDIPAVRRFEVGRRIRDAAGVRGWRAARLPVRRDGVGRRSAPRSTPTSRTRRIRRSGRPSTPRSARGWSSTSIPRRWRPAAHAGCWRRADAALAQGRGVRRAWRSAREAARSRRPRRTRATMSRSSPIDSAVLIATRSCEPPSRPFVYQEHQARAAC